MQTKGNFGNTSGPSLVFLVCTLEECETSRLVQDHEAIINMETDRHWFLETRKLTHLEVSSWLKRFLTCWLKVNPKEFSQVKDSVDFNKTWFRHFPQD